MIPAYNCAAFLPDALNSVLAQAPGPEHMQIEVVDDASTDADVEALVAAIGQGRVGYYRQPRNVGSIRNFETSINRARGHVVHLLHGDDRVRPGFYAKLDDLLRRFPEAGAAVSHYAYIDEAGRPNGVPTPQAEADGILENWLLRLAEYQRMQYVSTVVRRSVYEALGSFYGNSYGEDWEMWVRIARYYPVAYTPDVLAEYRGHTQSISSNKLQTGEVVTDLAQVMARVQAHVPAAQRRRLAQVSGQHYAHFVIGAAYQLAETTKDWGFVHRLVRKSLELSRHPAIYRHVVRSWAKYMLEKFRKG
ncbi:glycosyltransferase [Hymenobacter sp. BT523]|nr:glycosyltransferase [Hymenobacter sp. BT523]